MLITSIQIYRYSIPMVPFTIATGTMDFAQNLLVIINTDEGISGYGECSAFPMIVGETQATCYEMGKAFAAIFKHKDPLDIEARMQELEGFTARNYTAKSAFDIALHDIAAKRLNQPLYAYLGGKKRKIVSDLTIGIDSPTSMADQAIAFVNQGVETIKVKLGKNHIIDIERIKAIRAAIGYNTTIRIDANQGWSYEEAVTALTALGDYQIEFCEQPMRTYNDEFLPQLCTISPIPLMADESVYTHHDAERVIRNKACASINIKFAKSGGITEAIKINDIAEANNISCMMGGMLESRLALTAKVHFAMAMQNIIFYDLDTCLLGHKTDPVLGGAQYKGMELLVNDTPGIGASVDPTFLETLESITI
ncbi:mandelate racemase/muconate lactonizing enzyme family protein [Sediminibacterium sp.]|uniref:mandelate racemase/muconate lactonizing enzyme family protein n=1 Tax=Sediminibacterium sp. TaxID=1917865 RepID=UPI003F6E9787